jgi:hypothetical protein
MNEQSIKQALNYLADKAVPTNYAPTPIIRKRLEATLRLRQNHIERKNLSKRLSFAGLFALLVLLAGAIFFLMPPGRAVAHDLLRFFTFANSDILPLPTSQPTELPHPTRMAAPTYLVQLQQVTPAESVPSVQSYPTASPVPQRKTSFPTWNLTLDQAEQLAGFKLRVPLSLPTGYRLDNVTFDPRTGEVSQFYEFHPYSAGEQFVLSQRLSQPTDVIGQSATAEQMTIAGIEVEYVGGAWTSDAGDNAETWDSNSIFHTFHWQQGELYFTLVFLFDDSDTWSPAFWTKDGMLTMIEVIMGSRAEYPGQVNYNNLTNIDQAEEVAGFDLLVPSILPEGFSFTRAVYQPETKKVLLFYQPQEGSRAVSGIELLITETLGSDQPINWEGFPPDALEKVMIGSSPATFVRGVIVDGIYHPDASLSLVWNTAELFVKISYTASSTYPAHLEKNELITIAESME